MVEIQHRSETEIHTDVEYLLRHKPGRDYRYLTCLIRVNVI